MIKLCKKCNKEFELKSIRHPHQEFCSPKCNKDYYYQNNKSLWKEHYSPEKNKIKCHTYYYKNHEKCLKNMKEYFQKNKFWILPRQRRYDKLHHKHLTDIKVARKRERYATDLQFHLREKLRARIRLAFSEMSKNGKISTCKEYNIDLPALLKKLKETLPQDYSEQKYHIDHIKPLKTFNLDDSEAVKIAFSPENTQWLTQEANLKKGARF